MASSRPSGRHRPVDHHAVELDQAQRTVAAHRIEPGDGEALAAEIANRLHVPRHTFIDADYRGRAPERRNVRQALPRAFQHLDVEALGVELEVGPLETQ